MTSQTERQSYFRIYNISMDKGDNKINYFTSTSGKYNYLSDNWFNVIKHLLWYNIITYSGINIYLLKYRKFCSSRYLFPSNFFLNEAIKNPWYMTLSNIVIIYIHIYWNLETLQSRFYLPNMNNMQIPNACFAWVFSHKYLITEIMCNVYLT